MAYDEGLAGRVEALLDEGPDDGYVTKKMFGGVAMMLAGNMAVGVLRDGLLVRVPHEETEELLAEPGAIPFEMGHQRAGKGWVVVRPDALDDEALRAWVGRGVAYARTLPPK